MYRYIVIIGTLCLTLSACLEIDSAEITDQSVHYVQGYGMACDAARWGDHEEVVEAVMTWARFREHVQHPDGAGSGSARDLAFYLWGAQDGVDCSPDEVERLFK